MHEISHVLLAPLQAFAQCRPMAQHMQAGECVDDDVWQCPLSWMGKLPVAAAPPPPRVGVCTSPSAEFGACYDSWCCENKGFGCFKKVGRVRVSSLVVVA